MLLERVALSNFRNYEALEFAPLRGLNLLVGANAQGKSNLLEAIAMLGTGKSFRTARDADTVREGCDLAVVHGRASVAAGSVELACSIERGPRGTRKTYTLNGGNVRYASYLGRVRVVTFVPVELQLATGPPSLRRALLNGALSQEEPRYYRELARYRKTVAQKNALLRAPEEPDPELLAVYDRTLVESGAELMLARHRFVEELAAAAARAHERFSRAAEHLDVRYAPNVASETFEREAIERALAARLVAVAASERARKTSVAGPHRDDLTLAIDGRPLDVFGSQGQQRTAVLALKIAEYTAMRDRAGEAPLLLLDDVLSELDRDRAEAFLAGVGEYEQAFVTATAVPAQLAGTGGVFEVRAATVTAC